MHHGEKFNAFSHLAGAALALTGLVFLTVRASLRGDPWKIASAGIYGATLVGLYFFSTLYHSARDGGAKKILRKIDHSAIYLLIAGTYTPFTLVTLRGAWGWSLFGVIWGLAVTGIIQDLLFAKGHRIFSVVLYLLMGWLSLTAIRPLIRALPAPALALLVAGGLS
jgi:hemolysin III